MHCYLNQLIIRDKDNLWGVGEQRELIILGYKTPLTPSLGFGANVIVTGWHDYFSWDGLVSWTSEPQYWYDILTESFSRFMAPLYTEQTASVAFAGGRTFFAIKQVNDLYLDRHIYYVRAMPMAETWIGKNIGIRLGAEGSAVINNERFNPGWGGTAGLSIKLSKYTLDANYTLRQRPSRSLDYLIVPESVLYISLSMNGLFKQ